MRKAETWREKQAPCGGARRASHPEPKADAQPPKCPSFKVRKQKQSPLSSQPSEIKSLVTSYKGGGVNEIKIIMIAGANRFVADSLRTP